jgi:hypothetical protein
VRCALYKQSSGTFCFASQHYKIVMMVGHPECEPDHTTDNDRRLIPSIAGFRVGTDTYVKVRKLLRAFRRQVRAVRQSGSGSISLLWSFGSGGSHCTCKIVLRFSVTFSCVSCTVLP